tara:strand:+ start:931 stop:1326 length:396 start_codon:yes stop_codon:yes gene_type:complete
MKLIKLKINNKYKYKRKVFIKDLILNISVGIHSFEKKKKQKVKFNLEIISNPLVKPDLKNFSTLVDYEDIVKKIIKITKNKHHNLLEDLAESIFNKIFEIQLVNLIKLRIEKIEILKNTSSVGIEIEKTKL